MLMTWRGGQHQSLAWVCASRAPRSGAPTSSSCPTSSSGKCQYYCTDTRYVATSCRKLMAYRCLPRHYCDVASGLGMALSSGTPPLRWTCTASYTR